eukprot:2017888-Rhodomonas_salina.1
MSDDEFADLFKKMDAPQIEGFDVQTPPTPLSVAALLSSETLPCFLFYWLACWLVCWLWLTAWGVWGGRRSEAKSTTASG